MGSRCGAAPPANARTARGVGLLLVDGSASATLRRSPPRAARSPLSTGNSRSAAAYPSVVVPAGRNRAGRVRVRCPASTGPGAVMAGSVDPQTLAKALALAHRNHVFTLDLRPRFADEDVSATRSHRTPLHCRGCHRDQHRGAPRRRRGLASALWTGCGCRKAEGFLSAIAKRIVSTSESGVDRCRREKPGAGPLRSVCSELSIGPYEGPGLNRAIASPLPD